MNALDVVYAGVAAVTAPWWLRRTRGGWAERFVRTPPRVRAKAGGEPRVMVHAVSVGEVSALRTLVPMLAERGAKVVVSATTDTGIRRAHELYDTIADVVRYPLDASRAVGRFLDAVEPDVVGLVELEVWPNFVSACRQRAIPVGVINGRLSERSCRGYRRLGFAMRGTFASLDFAQVQDETYRERFRSVGTASERTRVTGSMKFDAAASPPPPARVEALAREMGIDPTRPLIVGASTTDGEEALIHDAWSRNLQNQNVQLLVAPRHPGRFEEAASALPGATRRSAGLAGGASGLFLLDTIGELGVAYALADVVVIGRSFAPRGGSDPIEPVARGAAAVAGPDMKNFGDIAEGFERAGAMERCEGGDLGGVLERLIAEDGRRAEMAERGRAWISEQSGATARHADALLDAVRRTSVG